MLTLITPTGERPEAIKLCQYMMDRQTYSGDVHWIIVDDGEEPQEITFSRKGWKLTVLRPKPYWRMGQNTQGRNLIAALGCVDMIRDVVAIIEDDDYYGPGWLQFIANHTDEAELIGERGAIYYNVRERKWDALDNKSHACLRCSALRDGAIRTFREVLQKPDRYYDLQLWKRHPDRATFPQNHTIGIKGMPGRQGLAQGHDGLKGSDDPGLDALRGFIGDDADRYAEFYHEEGIYSDRLFCAKPMNRDGRHFAVGEEFTIPLTRQYKEIYIAAGFLARKTIRQTGENHA